MSSANGYTDGKVTAESAARQNADASTLSSANGYTDGKVTAESAARQNADASTLSSAKWLHRWEATAESAARQNADASTLSSANGYTDGKREQPNQLPGRTLMPALCLHQKIILMHLSVVTGKNQKITSIRLTPELIS
ncbi:hypothetical protein VRB18_22560 (plasmid) [Erwinia aphidicola]